MTAKKDLSTAMQQAMPRLAEVAPKWMSVERLTRLMLAARSRAPLLAECSVESVLQFCMKCAETGLDTIGAGGAWPVPFKNKHTGQYEVQFIPDWRGMVHTAKNEGAILDAYAELICDNEIDSVVYEKGDTPRLFHSPKIVGRGRPVAVYAVAAMPDGSKRVEMMDGSDVESIRARSKAKDSGPWVTDEFEMWKKTAVRRLLKSFQGFKRTNRIAELDNDATGLALPELHATVKMPTKRIAEHADTSEAIETASEPEGKPKPQTEDPGAQVVTGFVEKVTKKATARNDRYAVMIDNVWYSTFDKTVGEQAMELEHIEVQATVKSKGKFWDLLAIEPLAGDAGDDGPPATDEQGVLVETQDEMPY